MTTNELLEVAVDAASRAGELLLRHFRAPARGVATKSSPTDLVSDADRDAETLLVEAIAAARPDDGILAEEGGAQESSTGVSWVIDPLDGTINFLFHIPAWCVSVAAEDERGEVVAVIRDPNRDETFTAIRGEGAFINGAAISIGRKTALADALIGTGFAYEARARAVQAQRLPRVLPAVRDIRRAGSAALDLASVACARLDGFFEAPMERWDQAAGTLLVREAGGVTSELRAPFGNSHGVIAANPILHERLRRLVLG